MLSSCSTLVLKTLLELISQCSSVHYLKSGLCKVRNKLDDYDFAVVC